MTTLQLWSPLRDFDTMERRMLRLLDGLTVPPAVLPATDIYETGDEYVVELEVPGFEREELGIEVSDHQLTIKGRRTDAKDQGEKAFRLHERLAREFERRFVLPAEADTEHLRATFEKGVLEVHAPKARILEPKTVEITKA
ncbi:MAG TPA: Hsp20/alpha crystallin family protein [Gaiellaceae bacterium]|nr:Hsp20/alpha crystallin family protein [Gaiellaceae bacterium]